MGFLKNWFKKMANDITEFTEGDLVEVLTEPDKGAPGIVVGNDEHGYIKVVVYQDGTDVIIRPPYSFKKVNDVGWIGYTQKLEMADSSYISAYLLHLLATDPNGDGTIEEKIAYNPKVSPNTLAVLSDSKNLVVKYKVSRHLDTPQNILAKLAKDGDPAVRYEVGFNTNTSEETLRELIKDQDNYVKESVALNSNATSDILDQLLLETKDKTLDKGMSRNMRDDLLKAISMNKNASSKALVELSSSYDAFILNNVAGHRNTPLSTIMELAKHPSKSIKARALSNTSIPSNLLHDLVVKNPEDSDLWIQIAYHPNVSSETLSVMSKSTDRTVQSLVAQNSKTPPAILNTLANTDSNVIIEGLSKNPNAPVEVLVKLLNYSLGADGLPIQSWLTQAVINHPKFYLIPQDNIPQSIRNKIPRELGQERVITRDPKLINFLKNLNDLLGSDSSELVNMLEKGPVSADVLLKFLHKKNFNNPIIQKILTGDQAKSSYTKDDIKELYTAIKKSVENVERYQKSERKMKPFTFRAVLTPSNSYDMKIHLKFDDLANVPAPVEVLDKANYHNKGDIAWAEIKTLTINNVLIWVVMELQSDVLQRTVELPKEVRSKVENTYADWDKVLINLVLKQAKTDGVAQVWVASAITLMKHWNRYMRHGEDNLENLFKKVYNEQAEYYGGIVIDQSKVPSELVQGDYYIIDVNAIPETKMAHIKRFNRIRRIADFNLIKKGEEIMPWFKKTAVESSEYNDLVAKYLSGNISDEERDKLFLYIDKIVSKHPKINSIMAGKLDKDVDDLKLDVVYAIIAELKIFDFNRSALSSWIFSRVDWHIIVMLRDKNRLKRSPLSGDTFDLDAENLLRGGKKPSENETPEEKELREYENRVNKEISQEQKMSLKPSGPKHYHLNDNIEDEEGGEETVESIVPSREQGQDRILEGKEIMRKIVTELEAKDELAFNIFIMLTENPDMTNVQLANEMGISQSYVDKKIQTVIKPTIDKHSR